MHAFRQISLGIALAAFAPLFAGEIESSFSLNQLQSIARSSHPTLDAAEAAMGIAEGALRQAQAYPNPDLAVALGRGRPRDGGDSRWESSILLLQPIEVSGIRRWRTRAAELNAVGVGFDRSLAESVVDSTVSRLVYAALLERRRAKIANESAQVALRLHGLLERRVEIGESSPLEAVKARSEWFARRRDVVGAETALAAARSILNRFCDNRLPEGYKIVETLEGPGAIPLPIDLVERLETHNPMLLRARVAVQAAEARTTVAKKEVFPRFDLFAAHETELDRVATSLGIGLTIPLWNRNRGGIAAAAADHDRATAGTRGLALELARSMEQASAAYRGALAAIRLHQEGWTASAKQALEIATFSFENGEASLLEVLDAERSHLRVRSAEAESWAALALARADLEQLLAGPLTPENIDEAR